MTGIVNRISKLRGRLRNRRDPVGFARSLGVVVGDRCRFLGTSSATFGSEPYLVRIGEHVTITAGVRFVTHDGGVWVLRDKHPEVDVFGTIDVGNNVFLGIGTIVLPGVKIGDNSVVGAGSVVNRDIPANSVAAGVPARVITSLDDYERRSLERAFPTKGMVPDEKKAFIQDRLAAAEQDGRSGRQ